MEKLKLACLDKTGNFYVVCKGDNLRTIAEKFSTTENLIINDNYLKNPHHFNYPKFHSKKENRNSFRQTIPSNKKIIDKN